MELYTVTLLRPVSFPFDRLLSSAHMASVYTCIFCTRIFCAIIYRTDINHRLYISIPAPFSSCATGFSIPSWSRVRLSSALPGHCFASVVDSLQCALAKNTYTASMYSSYLCVRIIIIYTVTPISILHVHVHSDKLCILHLI